MDCAIDERARADAQRERENRHGGERRLPAESPEGIARVVQDGAAPPAARRPSEREIRRGGGRGHGTELALKRFQVTELRERARACARVIESGPAQLRVAVLEVLRHFLHDLGFALGREAQRPEPLPDRALPLRHGGLRRRG